MPGFDLLATRRRRGSCSCSCILIYLSSEWKLAAPASLSCPLTLARWVRTGARHCKPHFSTLWSLFSLWRLALPHLPCQSRGLPQLRHNLLLFFYQRSFGRVFCCCFAVSGASGWGWPLDPTFRVLVSRTYRAGPRLQLQPGLPAWIPLTSFHRAPRSLGRLLTTFCESVQPLRSLGETADACTRL